MEGGGMVYSQIRYTLHTPSEEWEREVVAFIDAVECDPSLSGRISYRSYKGPDGVSFCHMSGAADAGALADLMAKPFFKQYAARVKEVSKSGPEVTQLNLVGGTKIQL